MAKKWNDYTKREKVFGGIMMVLAVFAISGVSSAMNGGSLQTPSSTQPITTQEVTPAPITTFREVSETETIPFTKTTIDDATLNKGISRVTTNGVDRIKTKTYKVTFVDGTQTKRELIEEEVTAAPISEITSIGTYVAPVSVPTPAPAPSPDSGCDSNYSGCVPIASDVDCGGGSGNGPAYLYGVVSVIGSDIYGLDRDGDGLACE